MIERLEIKNFALARGVALSLAPGLNVFTGEAGAGKSLVVDALAFALGARKGVEVIASGAERTEVRVVLADGSCIERVIGRTGRTVLRLDGAPSSVDVVRELTSGRIEIHGQSEQLALLRPAVQLEALDRFAGCLEEAARFSSDARRLRAVRRELAAVRSDDRERERRIGQLRFEVSEIESASLTAGEPEALGAERRRLAATEQLRTWAQAALAALEQFPVGDLVQAVSAITGEDGESEGLAESALLLEANASDLTRSLRHYAEGIEEDPERLRAIEERLDLIFALRRKYGDTVDEILAYGSSAAEELAATEQRSASEQELLATEEGLITSLSSGAAGLSAGRRRFAAALGEAVAAELARLGMEGASFAVGFACTDNAEGLPVALPDYEVVSPGREARSASGDAVPRWFGDRGVDQIEFLASFNRGEDLRALATVASGGETSRFLLALTAVFGSTGGRQTIVLDEADEGVGGRSGSLVGEALARLAVQHQVLCVTHLPQVAAHGDRHFVVSKGQTKEGRAESSCREVAGGERIEELAAMLGGRSTATLKAAEELLAHASGLGPQL